MHVLPLAMIVAAFVLSGCASSVPFAGAQKGRVYSLDEFEEALLEEKARILEAELKRVRYFGLSEPREVELTPFVVPEYPLLAEWMQVRARAVDGDQLWEYRHRDHGRHYDGPAEATKRGYALVRDGRVIAFMPVDVSWWIEY